MKWIFAGGVPGTQSADAVQRDGRVHGQRHVWHTSATSASGQRGLRRIY